MNAKGSMGKVRGNRATMNKPAMMDWALRLLRVLNEKKVLTSRVVAKEFVLDFIGGIRATGRRYPEIPENIRKALHEAKTIWFNDKEPDRVTVAFDANVAHFFERKEVFPRQEIVGKYPDGKIVVAFDVHNEMDFREQISRWMPYFKVLSPDPYRLYILGVCEKATAMNVATPAPGIPVSSTNPLKGRGSGTSTGDATRGN